MTHNRTPKTTAPALRAARGRARRTLSQNFLADPVVLRRYVRAVGSGPRDLVIEVGAGDGRITAELAAYAARVVAYEIERFWRRGYAPAAAGWPTCSA